MKPDLKTKILSSWCAASPEVAKEIFPALVTTRQRLANEDTAWHEVLTTLDTPQLIRMLALTRARRLTLAPLDLNRLTFANGNALWDGQPIGLRRTYYKTVLPYEAQTRVAYDIFFDRFVAFVGREYKAVVLQHNDLTIDLFVPGTEFEIDQIWDRFTEFVFSKQQIYSNLGQMLNTFKLVDREPGGFGFLFNSTNNKKSTVVPSQDLADFIVALYYAVMKQRILFAFSKPVKTINQVEKKVEEWSQRYQESDSEKSRTQAEAKLSEWATKLAELKEIKEQEVADNRATLKSYDEEIAGKMPDAKFHTICREAQYFNWIARRQFGPGTVKPDGLAKEVVRIINEAKIVRITTLLSSDSLNNQQLRSGGDKEKSVCYTCGRVWPRDQLLKASLLVMNPSSQRPQSGSGQIEPPICNECYAISFISPIKMGTSHLVIRLEGPDIDIEEEYLRGLVTGELGLTAGRYLLLVANEKYGEKDKVAKKIGGTQYALYRVACEFEPEVFESLKVTAFIEGSEVPLPSRYLVWLNQLIQVFDLQKSKWPANKPEEKAQFASFGKAIRHIQNEEVLFAIYKLLKTGLTDVAKNFSKLVQLEALREQHIKGLEMSEMNAQAQFYKDVAAMTGLLYPFCSYVRSKVRENNGSLKKQRIEVEKVIGRSNDPFQFDYTVAGHTKSERATLFHQADLHFSYDQAKALLDEIKIDSTSRETTNAKNQNELVFYFDDVVKAHTYLIETRYQTTKQQRKFNYALQLSLYSRFADLIQEKETD